MSPPPDGPALRVGVVVTGEELAALARAAFERDGRSLTALSAALKKSAGYVHDALYRPERNLTALRLSILQQLAGYTADGPLYRLRKADAADTAAGE